MSLIDETQNLERRVFFNSERLFDVDLNDQEAFHREMRWLHNRSLHQPGVGNGYRIVGSKGDREVTIGAGYAIDALGREIILTREVLEAIPPVAGEDGGTPAFYYLAVRYPDDSRLDEAETRSGVCGSRGAVRLAERPLLCWVRLAVDTTAGPEVLVPKDPHLRTDVNSGMLIVLALVEIFQCRLNNGITEKSFAPRRSARPPRLPFTASAVEAKLVWTVEVIDGLGEPAPNSGLLLALVRLKATVRVTNAVFGAIPRYLVRVEGDRLIAADPTKPDGDKVYAEPQVEVLLAQNLTDHTKFTVAVSMLIFVPTLPVFASAKETFFVANQPAKRDALATYLRDKWSIVWVGIEG